MDSLKNILGRTVSVVFTDNAVSMISVRKKGSGAEVRIHRMFLGAEPPVVREIAEFIRNGRGKMPFARGFIRQNSGLLKKADHRRRAVVTAGRFHDLLSICRRVNAEYFGGRIGAVVTWGTRPGRRAVRRRTLGSYNSGTGMITINPVLDSKKVPGYFVEFIVYHEMLHADMGTEKKNGRRVVHSREFRIRERLYGRYEAAISWENKWIAGG